MLPRPINATFVEDSDDDGVRTNCDVRSLHGAKVPPSWSIDDGANLGFDLE